MLTTALTRILLRIYTAGARPYRSPLLLREWERVSYPKNERAVEYAFALESLAAANPDSVLDVGTGLSAWPHLVVKCGFRVTAVDKVSGYWREGYFNRHYWIVNDDITRPRRSGQFDFITCLSTLKHIPEHDRAVRGMFSLLRPKGRIALTFPYDEREYVPNAYDLPGSLGRGARYCLPGLLAPAG